jgi:hypothetical protein
MPEKSKDTPLCVPSFGRPQRGRPYKLYFETEPHPRSRCGFPVPSGGLFRAVLGLKALSSHMDETEKDGY